MMLIVRKLQPPKKDSIWALPLRGTSNIGLPKEKGRFNPRRRAGVVSGALNPQVTPRYPRWNDWHAKLRAFFIISRNFGKYVYCGVTASIPEFVVAYACTL